MRQHGSLASSCTRSSSSPKNAGSWCDGLLSVVLRVSALSSCSCGLRLQLRVAVAVAGCGCSCGLRLQLRVAVAVAGCGCGSFVSGVVLFGNCPGVLRGFSTAPGLPERWFHKKIPARRGTDFLKASASLLSLRLCVEQLPLACTPRKRRGLASFQLDSRSGERSDGTL
jgi:hypothetical protein